ncbi:MAG TPA: DUF1552 domain-containing protein [Polyangiaceae bacterium]|nr:DUF1552 domain-containing protein [Polyangiaceae bacterium]
MRFSRRKLLGAAGVAIALPALEALQPKLGYTQSKPAPKRFLVYFAPNGRVPANWTPKETGTTFSLQAASKSFEPFKKDLIFLTGLYHGSGVKSGGGGAHAKGCGTLLTSTTVLPNMSKLDNGISLDQAMVKALAPSTPYPSLQWGAGEPWACDAGGASCQYTQTLSWSGANSPLMPVTDPLTAFNQIFGGGEGANEAEQAKRRVSLQSVLDYVQSDAKQLRATLGAGDKARLDEYLTSVREVELRLTNPGGACEAGPAPGGGLDYPARVQAFNELIVLALQCGQTQILTFMIENGLSSRPHPFLNAPTGHHALSHGAGPDQLLRVETWQTEQAAALVKKLQDAKELDGSSLLDSSIVLFTSDMGLGNSHDHTNLAPVLLGRGGGALNVGRAIDAKRAPLGNLYVALLQAMGIETTTFGEDGVAPLNGVLA